MDSIVLDSLRGHKETFAAVELLCQRLSRIWMRQWMHPSWARVRSIFWQRAFHEDWSFCSRARTHKANKLLNETGQRRLIAGRFDNKDREKDSEQRQIYEYVLCSEHCANSPIILSAATAYPKSSTPTSEVHFPVCTVVLATTETTWIVLVQNETD